MAKGNKTKNDSAHREWVAWKKAGRPARLPKVKEGK